MTGRSDTEVSHTNNWSSQFVKANVELIAFSTQATLYSFGKRQLFTRSADLGWSERSR